MTHVRPAALVVGATGAMGSEIVARLASDGFAVTAVGRRGTEIDRLVHEHGSAVHGLVGDLSDLSDSTRLVTDHHDRFGRLDLLVNTAGAAQHRPLVEVDMTRSRRLLDVNVAGVVALLAAALPAMRETAKTRPGALVVLLSSLVAARPAAGFALYSATKAAVSSLARSVNEEENANGIRATAICPGFVESSFSAGLEAQAGEFLPATDVAQAVQFLVGLSPQARVPELEIGRTGADVGRP